jgi:hypothetical protein
LRTQPFIARKLRPALAGALLAACIGKLDVDGLLTKSTTPPPAPVADAGTPAVDAGQPYQPVSVSSAVAKVKNLLVGMPPTDAEVQAVTANQSALYGLVGTWMAMPQYQAKMQSFFATAFQQTEVTQPDFAPQFNNDVPFSRNQPQFLEDFQQSFARTAMQLIAEGQPFTSTMTTTRFMMTPAMMMAYAAIESVQTSDTGEVVDEFQKTNPTSMTLESATMIPIEDSIDPTNANYMKFYDPTIATQFDPLCPYGTIVYPSPVSTRDFMDFLLSHNPFQFTVTPAGQTTPHKCNPPSVPMASAYITNADFDTWQMITVRPPNAGEATTKFWDLPAIRTATELVLKEPRVGFYTTPTFLAEWATNQSNLARVTLNQTMIVGLGEPIDTTNTTQPQSLAALDSNHAAPGTTCYVCHQSLDPMRQFFRQQYTLDFSLQADTSEVSMPGQFAFHGVSVQGTGILDLGTQLAGHPMFAPAWVQKLCTYANSAPCDPNDPEFIRLVGVFTSSNYSWPALVQALFASPIVTYLQNTTTADVIGETFPISRQEHLCTTLSNRLGITDVCGLDVNTVVPGSLSVVQTIAASWPSDQYSRGNPTPVLANAPSLFMRTGMENLCGALSNYLIDNTKTGLWKSTSSTTAIQAFGTTLMGLTSDRSAVPISILQGHFNAAEQGGSNASDALKSTFVLACLSPYVIGVGQ